MTLTPFIRYDKHSGFLALFDKTLREALGFTKKEYALFVENLNVFKIKIEKQRNKIKEMNLPIITAVQNHSVANMQQEHGIIVL